MANDLTAAISRLLDAHGVTEGYIEKPSAALTVMRTSERMTPRHMTYRPALCIVAQGAKEVLFGDRVLTYGDMQSLLVTFEVPVVSQIIRASVDEPYVAATLNLDPEIILEVMTRLGPPSSPDRSGPGMIVDNLDARICGALGRLLEIADDPGAIDILYPAIMREISYWLLVGPAGGELVRMVLPSSPSSRIAKAVQHLRESFAAPVNMAQLARSAGMSASSFHHHFKSLTAMSPLQYQKHIRLLEARRLMVADGEKASVAAFAVGYESLSQFSREYTRMFGAPPLRETRRARAQGAGERAFADAAVA